MVGVCAVDIWICGVGAGGEDSVESGDFRRNISFIIEKGAAKSLITLLNIVFFQVSS